MGKFLNLLETHAGVILLCVIVLLVIDAILRVFFYGKARNTRSSRDGKGDNALASALLKEGLEGFVLIDNESGMPISVSDSISKFVGLKKESVYADLSLLFRGFSVGDRENIIGELNEWNKKDKFIYEAFWKLEEEEEKYYQIMV